MSKSAHAQGAIKLRDLPKCSRCKQQFMLVTVQYETNDGKSSGTVEEWECEKCNKFVPKEFLKEEGIPEFDKFLHKRSKELRDEQRRNKQRDSEEASKRRLREQSK